jgi:hypothetical protein
MAKLAEIHDVVFNFAKHTSLAITPGAITDPIVPSPQQMTDDVYKDFYFALLHALAEGNITATMPFEQVRNCKTWFHISTLVFHSQGGRP